MVCWAVHGALGLALPLCAWAGAPATPLSPHVRNYQGLTLDWGPLARARVRREGPVEPLSMVVAVFNRYRLSRVCVSCV